MDNGNLINNLFATGAVVKVKVSAWSATKKLNPIELGLPENSINKDIINLGSKRLIPKEEMSKLYNIRAKANQKISTVSFDFDFGGNFVPNKKLDELKKELESLKKEFQDTVDDIGNRYPQMKQEIMEQWKAEAISIASRHKDPSMVDEIMLRVDSAFPDWEVVKEKFGFSFHEYRNINDIAKQFVEGSTQGILVKLGEFAEKLKNRILNSSLTERNLKPVREYLAALQDGLMVFENDKLNNVIAELDGWVMDGVSHEIGQSKDIADLMSKSLDKIINAAENEVEDISRASVEAMTSYKREIEL
jgi:hypothetical protein